MKVLGKCPGYTPYSLCGSLYARETGHCIAYYTVKPARAQRRTAAPSSLRSGGEHPSARGPLLLFLLEPGPGGVWQISSNSTCSAGPASWSAGVEQDDLEAAAGTAWPGPVLHERRQTRGLKLREERLVYNENCWVQGLSVLGLATPTHTFITFRNTVIRSHNNKYVPSDRKIQHRKGTRPLSSMLFTTISKVFIKNAQGGRTVRPPATCPLSQPCPCPSSSAD